MTLLDDWLDSELGDRIDRINHLAEHPTDDVQLEVEGYSETIRHRGWDANLNAEPYEPWQVGEYGSATDPNGTGTDRYDTAGCETAAGMWLPGASGDYASTPDNASLDITGDLDLRADVALQSWASGVLQILVGKYTTPTAQRSYRLEISATGFLQLTWSTDGTATLTRASTVAPDPTPTGRLAVRATLDVNNGAAGHTVTFYTATATGGLSDSDVTWVQLGDPVVTAGTTSIFSGSAALEVGSSNSGAASRMTGTAYAIQVRNGIGGTIVSRPRFDQHATGTTSFSQAGLTWTVNGNAAIYHDFAAGTDTAMLVITTLGQSWTQDADDLPMELRISGAVLEVTAVTGTGTPQLFTVTASAVNGVAKTIVPGESVVLARPGIYAL